ncbi:MAG: hypothetical protein Tsb005_18330 [Gammaproteobacteria bacterium]
MMKQQALMQELATILEVDPKQLSPDAPLSGFEAWDSMAQISLISFIDSHFTKQLALDTLESFSTPQDIIDFLGDEVTH